ncbi:uncharacterized protein BJ171DRAFT_495648 [Polychytrium aggregatum]|uniref:uncharacterized protein n=1 Tax=Polychytrium aggregatum TaxID=110093 RepID=UPI0022FEC729|nr:uncharacterized protein BJ171DRAFT_495648 [Polychytrium aggregatum]KAI9207096.1 hypothetical protein BJ171DRAFT_495648 [Polychytrium aggregatum]
MQWPYSIEVPDAPEIPGEGKPRLSPFGEGVLISELPNTKSIYENFLNGRKIGGDKPFLGRRIVVDGVAGPYVWETYDEVYERINNMGAGFRQITDEKKANIGIFSINRPEWIITEYACFVRNFVTVPLYDTLGTDAIKFICNQSKLSIVAATKDKALSLLKIKAHLHHLKWIILLDESDEAVEKLAHEHGVKTITIVELERLGSENKVEPELPGLDDIAVISYTSGTTGTPKGAVVTHRGMLAFTASRDVLLKTGHMYNFTSDDVYISYLPLAHVYERVVQSNLIGLGARIGFFQGDTLKLLDDVAELKPTIFASVPRLYNRIYAKVMESVKERGGIAETLFNFAYAAKKHHLASGYSTHFLWDRLVFGSVRARLGGRVKVMLTGAAPIGADVVDFLRICFSCDLYQGYGSTETAAAISCTDPLDLTSGHLGSPHVCVEIKLVDIPEMDYFSTDSPNPRGEICVRGASVMTHYYEEPEKTAEAIDKDGWFHTGDVGAWDEQGRLLIIDRLKNIFKLAQGEYIAPEKIEIEYSKHAIIAQAFVHGDSLRSSLVGIIVPDEEQFMKWAAEHGFEDKAFAELCADDAVRKAVVKTLSDFGRANGLKGFECIRNVYLETSPFSAEKDLLTPTFKLKRHQAKIYYEKQIHEMYESMRESA